MILRALYRNTKTNELVLVNPEENNLCAYQHVQHDASDIWVIPHSGNSTLVKLQVFVDNEMYIPASVVIAADELRIEFNEAVVGFVNFTLYNISNEVCPEILITPTPTPTVTPTVTPTNTVTPTVTPTPSA